MRENLFYIFLAALIFCRASWAETFLGIKEVNPGISLTFEIAAKDTILPAPFYLPEKDNFKNYIKRIPMGVSFVIAPWNYPYLTSVNSIIPSLAAGNSVILKHSAQTPLCAEQLYESAKKTLPKNIFSYLHLNHQTICA